MKASCVGNEEANDNGDDNVIVGANICEKNFESLGRDFNDFFFIMSSYY